MADPITTARKNPLAPDLARPLSPEVQALIADHVAHPGQNPYATKNEDALRRLDEPRDRPTPLRPAFMRDAEKILHLPAYNRLAGQTQVFSFHADEDLSRRGLHVQLVSRVARDIGRALDLNCDLIEAIALGHDIGHTPFGHAGERFLDGIYRRRTGRRFFHNVHSVRVLDAIYGRNLTLQTLDGVLCHNGEYEQREFQVSGISTFDEFDAAVAAACTAGNSKTVRAQRPMTLEGCVVRLSDIIAYVGKDRQDAIRAHHVGEDTFDDGLGGAYNSWALDAFISDVVAHSLGQPRIAMSQEGFEELRRAKQENYRKIYASTEVAGTQGAQILSGLFELAYESAYQDLAAGNTQAPIFVHHIDPIRAGLSYYGRTYDWERDLDQTVVDYIAGMTDDYFIALAERLDPAAAKAFPQHDYFFGKGAGPWDQNL